MKDNLIVNSAVPLKDVGFWKETCQKVAENKTDALRWMDLGIDAVTTVAGAKGLKSAVSALTGGNLTKEASSDLMSNAAAFQDPAQICSAITGSKINGLSYEYSAQNNKLYLVIPEPGKSHDTLLTVTTPKDFNPSTNPLLNPQYEKKGLFECPEPNSEWSLRHQWEHRLNCNLDRENSLRKVESQLHEAESTVSKPVGRGPSSVGLIIEDESLAADQNKLTTRSASQDEQAYYQKVFVDLQFLQAGMGGFTMYAESTNNKDLKIASQLAGTAIQAAGAMIALIGGMSCIGPIGALVGVGFALFSLFNKSNEKSFEQIMQESLLAIQKQLADFRRENAETLARLERQQLHLLEVVEARLDHLERSFAFGFYHMQRSVDQLIKDVRTGFEQLARQIQLDAITVYLRPFQKLIYEAQNRLHPETAEVHDQEIVDELSRWLMQAAFDDVGNGYNLLKAFGEDIWVKLYQVASLDGTYHFKQSNLQFYHYMRLWSLLASQFCNDKEKQNASHLTDLAPNILVWSTAAANLAELEYNLKLNLSQPNYDRRLLDHTLQVKNWLDAWLDLRTPDFFNNIHQFYLNALNIFNQEFKSETDLWKQQWYNNLKEKNNALNFLDPLLPLPEICQQLAQLGPLFFDSYIENTALTKVDHISAQEDPNNVIPTLRMQWSRKHDKWPVQFLQKLFCDPQLSASNRQLSPLFTLANIIGLGQWKFSVNSLHSVLSDNNNLDFPYHQNAQNNFNHPRHWQMDAMLKISSDDNNDNEIAQFSLTGDFPEDSLNFQTTEQTQGQTARTDYLREVIDGLWATYQVPKEFDLHAISSEPENIFEKKLTQYFVAQRCAYAAHMKKWLNGVGRQYIDALGSVTTFLHAVAYLLFPDQYEEIRENQFKDYLDFPRLNASLDSYMAMQNAFEDHVNTLPWPEGHINLTAPEVDYEMQIKQWQAKTEMPTATEDNPEHPLALINQGVGTLLTHLAKKADFERRYPSFVKRVNWEKRQALETYSALDSRLGQIIGLLGRIINQSFFQATTSGIYAHAGLSIEELWNDFISRAKLIAERSYIDATQKYQVEMVGQNEAKQVAALSQDNAKLESLLFFADNVLSHRDIAFESKEASTVIFHSNADLYAKMLDAEQTVLHVPLWLQGASAFIQLVQEYFLEIFVNRGLSHDDPHALNFLRQATERIKMLLNNPEANPYKAQQYLMQQKLEPVVLQKLAQGYKRICQELFEPSQAASGIHADNWQEVCSKSLAALSVFIVIFINTLYEPEEAPNPEEFRQLQQFFVAASQPDFFKNQTPNNLLSTIDRLLSLIQDLADTYTSVLVFVQSLLPQLERKQDAFIFIDGQSLAAELEKLGKSVQRPFELKPEHWVVLDKLLTQYSHFNGISFRSLKFSERFFTTASNVEKFYGFFKKYQFKIRGLDLDTVSWVNSHSNLQNLTEVLNLLPGLEFLSLDQVSLAQEENVSERYALGKSLHQLKALCVLHLRNLGMSHALLECLTANLPATLQSIVIDGHGRDQRILFAQSMQNMPLDLTQFVNKLSPAHIKILTSLFNHCPNLKALDWPDLKSSVDELKEHVQAWPQLAYCNLLPKDLALADNKVTTSEMIEQHDKLMQLLTKEALKTIRELLFFPAADLARILTKIEDIQAQGIEAYFDPRPSVFIGDWSFFNIANRNSQSEIPQPSLQSKLG